MHNPWITQFTNLEDKIKLSGLTHPTFHDLHSVYSAGLSPVSLNISSIPTSLNYLQFPTCTSLFLGSVILHMLFPISGMPEILFASCEHMVNNHFLKLSSNVISGKPSLTALGSMKHVLSRCSTFFTSLLLQISVYTYKSD